MDKSRGIYRLKAKCAEMGIPYTVDSPESVFALCRKAGVSYIHGNCKLDDFLDAIEAVAAGKACRTASGPAIRKDHAR